MSLATIEATSQGFNLHIVDKRLEYIAKLDRDLMVEAAYWVDLQQQIQTDITPFSYQPVVYIKPDGSFYFEDRTGDSSISTFHGIVKFLQGAETIVFGDR
ncbi:MAG: hypothetical protein KME17_12965 [Cyanosarcina radialis HA8281-LM2]|jgi:hypothetical protein|nr:hypothetical protein [Cyanosarcina radialis HA8281-LM2]